MSTTQPDPMLKVTVGTPIYTSDDQKIGNVKEVRRSAIKVETPFLQRDYWIDGDVVAEAVPDTAVVLDVDRAHVLASKIDEPPAE